MKKKIIAFMSILVISGVSSCGVANQSFEIKKIQNETSSAENTTEWVNQYRDNHKIISQQYIENNFGDCAYSCLLYNLPSLEFDKEDKKESCIAIVTLTDVKNIDSGTGTGQVVLKIEQILQNNGLEEKFVTGNEVCGDSGVKWTLCEDDTYEISFRFNIMPIVEIGYRYVVYLRSVEDETHISAMSLPFNINNEYIDTVATGIEAYHSLSNETLWYYDINSNYYLAYWAEHSEDAEYLKLLGKDVYNKQDVLK